MKPKGRIFVAGTGRSGTNVVASILGSHPDVARLSGETRFIVDPGGMRELFDVLTTRYDFYRASDAFSRFDEMMRIQLTGRTNTLHQGVRLDRLFGVSEYFSAIDRFESALTLIEFDEELSPEPSIENGLPLLGSSERRTHSRVVPRYFKNVEELADLCRSFIDTLFGDYAKIRGKTWWCEKTPFNLLNMDFLWHLFPDATIVHIKRDPRGVVASMKNQPWAPSDLDAAIELLIPTYERWLSEKNKLGLPDRSYLEIKLEDLAKSQTVIEREIYRTCGLSAFRSDIKMEPNQATWWHNALSVDDAKAITRRLEPYIVAMGYEVE